MQAFSLTPFSSAFKDSHFPSDSDEFAQISAKFAEDLRAKLKIEDESLRSEVMVEQKVVVDAYEKEEAEEEEEEFSFVCTNPDGSPISAEEVFDNGQIRPTFPLFNRDLLFIDSYGGSVHDGSSELRPPVRKYFIRQPGLSSSSSSESDEEPEGPYCEWSGKAAAENSPERCKKSNSTGFSKLRKFRDLVRRSSSDGEDAFVFLHASTTNSSSTEANKWKGKTKEDNTSQAKSVVAGKVKAPSGVKGKTASSAHEKHYVLNRARKESDKRRSYLPYKVGFFTNVNGMSRNVHPF
ncbi:hypothetical protein L6164_020628 [Bauhinia variegata]|uniref:Uncharacterized protein n=1 Tax=Bauhinia variegata TaxID=167791 RepID=A0ACB9MVM6_BAUVA|nr:hypothetical protein L6164_020628 [Bauhinia variegata]